MGSVNVHSNPAAWIIEKKFGGLSKTAALLSTSEKRMPVTTVQGWRDRGRIPQEHWTSIIDAGRRAGVELELEWFLRVPDEAAA